LPAHGARPHGFGGNLAPAALASVLTVGLTAVAVLGGVKTLELALAAVLAVVFVVVLLAVELSYLPTIGLLSFALVPILYLPVSSREGAFNPSLVVMVVLLVRAAAERRRIVGGPHLIPLALLALWVIVATIIAPRTLTSGLWSVNFLALTVIPALLLPGWREARDRLESCIMWLGGILGAYAAVEFLIHRNPLLESLYSRGSTPLVQDWDVYRVTTTLGHPLTNGTFFAIATMLGIGLVVRRPSRWMILATVLSGVGLIGSASRGPMLALAAGLVLTGLFVAFRRRRSISLRALLAAVALIAVLAVPGGIYISERSGGQEAAGSTLTRDVTYEAGIELAKAHWQTGGGPGMTDILKRELPTGQAARGVESSAFELLISLGLPGFLLATWLMLAVGFSALKNRPELAGCLIVYTVAAATFNLLEANRPALMLWGVLLGIATAPPTWSANPS
jgi:hypothetical protein